MECIKKCRACEIACATLFNITINAAYLHQILICFYNDRILIKTYHWFIMMIGNSKKHINNFAEDQLLNIDKKAIEQYLSEVKEAVENNNYRLVRNARRQDYSTNRNIRLHTISNNQRVKWR